MLDLKIAGGLVHDGTGAAPARMDVGIVGGRIAAVGDLSREPAREALDARGLTVCPGFIDVHTHSDTFLLIEPSAPSKVSQGVTTEVIGNCGASAAPREGGWRMPSDWGDKQYPHSWRTVAEFRALLEEARPAVNVAMLVGHGNLRGGVVGYGSRAAAGDELDRMVRLLEEGLDQGARGLSSGLVYPPGMFAGKGELDRLVAVVGGRGDVYASHMASEGDRLEECVEEMIRLGRATGAHIQISHLKTSGPKNWHKAPRVLDMIRRARAGGVAIAADRYPYTYGCTDLDVVFPKWAEEGGREAVLARLANPAEFDRIRCELLDSRPEREWANVTIASTWHPDNTGFRGRPLPEVAARLGLQPVDAILHLARTDELRTGAFFGSMCEENMIAILAEPFVMIGSDASIRAPEGPLSSDYPHPRAYGTFPKFLRMALDGRTVPLPEAIRKMTSLPAGQFRIADRGVIAAGFAADLVLFDPAVVRDTSAPDNPHRFAVGIPHVIVNGVSAVRNGAFTGNRSGRVL